MTGSLSAILILLGFGISIAGMTGTKVPYDSTIQLGTWVLAAVCGYQAAYAIWARERHAREISDTRLSELRAAGISITSITDYYFDQYIHIVEIEVKNISINEAGNCAVMVTEIFKNSAKEPIRELPLPLCTSLNKRSREGGSFSLRAGQVQKIPVCGLRRGETMLRVFVEPNTVGIGGAQGSSFFIHVSAYGAQRPSKAKLLIKIGEHGEMETNLAQ